MFPRPVIAKLPAICSALRHKLSARRKATEAVYFPPARPNPREELSVDSGSPGLHSAKGAAVQGDKGPLGMGWDASQWEGRSPWLPGGGGTCVVGGASHR